MGFFRREFREIAHILHLIEQVIWCSFCACFQVRDIVGALFDTVLQIEIDTGVFIWLFLSPSQTQHKIQLDDRDGLRAPQPDQSGLMAPEQQIMSQSTSP